MELSWHSHSAGGCFGGLLLQDFNVVGSSTLLCSTADISVLHFAQASSFTTAFDRLHTSSEAGLHNSSLSDTTELVAFVPHNHYTFPLRMTSSPRTHWRIQRLSQKEDVIDAWTPPSILQDVSQYHSCFTVTAGRRLAQWGSGFAMSEAWLVEDLRTLS